MLAKMYQLLIDASKILTRKGIYPFLTKQLSEIEPGASVLSVGAGGPIAAMVREFGQRREFDVDFFDVATVHKSQEIVGDICTYEFEKDEVYDHVVLAEVLEHLHSPQQAIDRIRRVLKKEGKLTLTVPFIFPIHSRPNDYFRFTSFGLEHLLREFTMVVIKERNSWGEAVNVLIVRLIMENRLVAKLLAPLIVLIAFLLAPFALLASRLIPSDFMTSGYLVVAKK